MAKEKDATPVVNPQSDKNKFHFLLRSVIRTAKTAAMEGAVTSAEFDAVVTSWLNEGWKIFDTQVVGFDELVFTVSVTLVRE